MIEFNDFYKYNEYQMTVELKNKSIGVKHFLEVINELSNIDDSKFNILDEEIERIK